METSRSGPETDDLTFEAAIERLEAVAERLEDPDTPLDEAVALYEEGVRLARRCADRLQEAELKIEELQTEGPATDDETDER